MQRSSSESKINSNVQIVAFFYETRQGKLANTIELLKESLVIV
jgi:hypothetical protein